MYISKSTSVAVFNGNKDLAVWAVLLPWPKLRIRPTHPQPFCFRPNRSSPIPIWFPHPELS